MMCAPIWWIKSTLLVEGLPFPGMLTIEQYDLLTDDVAVILKKESKDMAVNYPYGFNIRMFLESNLRLWRLEPQEDFSDVLPHDVQASINQKLSRSTLEIPALSHCLQASRHGDPNSANGSYFAWAREILYLNGIRIEDATGGGNANTHFRRSERRNVCHGHGGRDLVHVCHWIMTLFQKTGCGVAIPK
jgi:hypothetical protein